MAKLSPKSLLELKFISDAHLSNDGSQAVAVHTVIKQDDKKEPAYYQSSIYLYDFKRSKRLTNNYLSDSHARFSPDGKSLAFLRRNKDEKPQIWLMPLDGGEAKKLSSFKSGVASFVWQPNSKEIALVSKGNWENEIAKKGLPYEADRLQYKFNGVGLQPQENAQIYLLNIKTKKSKKLTSLEANPSQLIYSKDGKSLYFVASANINDADYWLNNIYSLEAPNEPKALLKKSLIASSPSPSPDNKHLVYLAPISSSFASPNGLFLMSTNGSKAKLLTTEYDIGSSPNGDSHYGNYNNIAKWLDNERVLVNLNHKGRNSLAEININSGEIKILDQEKRAISAFDYKNGSTIFIAETPQKPAELFLVKDQKEKRLSKLNDGFVRRYNLDNSGEEIVIKKHGQADISYWRLEPKLPRKDKALVLQVHGGPHTNYGYGFFHEFHMQAAAGYTVVYGNPRGSSSYGLDFAIAALGGYGTVDADDVMAIAKDALKNHSTNKAPMHLTGGSYGGFMANWLVGQNNFFTSAVSQRSITNWLSFYGSSDIGYRFAATEVDGNPWDDTDKLWQQSPMKYIEKVKTPILLIHSEEDHRCPMEQAEQFYIAIKVLNKTDTKLIRYPNESHELSRSGRLDRRIHRLEAIVNWFEKYYEKGLRTKD